MEINILHLYYDLLNLYGENGNIKALKKHLEEMGVRVNIEFLTINDVIDFSRYDFVYIGAGTEKSQKLVLKHLLKYKKDIKNYIESNKFFLATGNSLELFGKFIKTKDTTYKCLNIFDYESYEESDVFDEEPDDDISDITEDYKNLVIVDEEDLDNEQ